MRIYKKLKQYIYKYKEKIKIKIILSSFLKETRIL